MTDAKNDDTERPVQTDEDGHVVSEPSESGHSTAETQAARNTEDESPS